ncbi:LytR C-terminal domain-containing protein [Xylanimonas sp. McL0601]|uniref:LytR C-terminal domain-containing protein n=1 Tax=Xylanimonas sp. McL0601 TaxID=3414739 RepID=UPI003CEC6DA3
MTSPGQDPARLARRRREHERQAVIYGVLVALLAVAGLGALAIYTGAIQAPFARGFTSTARTDEAVTPPCLPVFKDKPDGVLPLPYGAVHVRIYNASGVAGIASANKTVLERRGFVIDAIGDYTTVINRNELRFGQKGIVSAYTLAAQFPSMRMVFDARKDSTVDFLVGEHYDRPLDEDKVTISADTPLPNMKGCKPSKDLTPKPAPAAASPAA